MIIFEGARTITTQNLNPNSGTPTAGSSATIDLSRDGASTVAVQTIGTYTGALTPQVSNDGVNWKTMGGVPLLDVNTGVGTPTIPSATQSAYQLDVAGFRYFRMTALAAMTGSVQVFVTGTDRDGLIALDAPLPAGVQNIGVVGTPSGTQISLTSAATTNATLSKSTAGNLFEVTIDNLSASPRFVKFYNKATAPTVGTDIPILTVPVAAGATVALVFGQIGKRFATGIGFAITGLAPVTDTTAVAAGDVHVHGSYI